MAGAPKKIYLINRDFQLRYARTAVMVGFFSTVLTVVLILFPLFQFRILRFPNFVPTPFLIAMAVAALMNFVMVAYFGIIATHRIAGPMFSLVRQFRLVARGQLQAQFKVRDRDEMKFVIRNFNEMIDGLAGQTRRDLEKIDRIVAFLSENGGAPALLSDALSLQADMQARLGPINTAGGDAPA